MKKSSIVIAVIFLLTMPVSGIPASTLMASPPPLRIGYIPLSSQLPLVLSVEGRGKPEGALPIKLAEFSSFTGLEAALRVGAIDAASLPTSIALNMAVDGIPIKILGSIHTGGSTLFYPQKWSGAGWKGRIVGVPGLDSDENIRLTEFFDQKYLRYGLDYRTINIPFKTAIADLRTGHVDALYFPEPFSNLAMKELDVVQDTNVYTGPLSTLVVRSHILEKDTSALTKEWLLALAGACKALEEHMEGGEVAGDLPDSFNAEAIVTSFRNRSGELRFALVPPDLQEMQSIMQKALQIKIIYRSVVLDDLVHPQLMREVIAELEK